MNIFAINVLLSRDKIGFYSSAIYLKQNIYFTSLQMVIDDYDAIGTALGK